MEKFSYTILWTMIELWFRGGPMYYKNFLLASSVDLVNIQVVNLIKVYGQDNSDNRTQFLQSVGDVFFSPLVSLRFNLTSLCSSTTWRWEKVSFPNTVYRTASRLLILACYNSACTTQKGNDDLPRRSWARECFIGTVVVGRGGEKS